MDQRLGTGASHPFLLDNFLVSEALCGFVILLFKDIVRVDLDFFALDWSLRI